MTDLADKIGVTRQHRWLSADKQAEILVPRCRKVVSLSGGSTQIVTREDLERLIRPGTVIELVHAFLLADPKRKRTAGGMKADFRSVLGRIEKRGGIVVDVDAGICSQKNKRALLALVDSDLARSNRGAKSAANGARSRGRPKGQFSLQQLKDAKAIWRNVKDYPNWVDTRAPLGEIVDPNGIKFTPDRAYDLWKGRK
jgi:hypothetical protein